MSWQDLINPQTAVWRGVEAYAQERIGQLTTVCINPRSSDSEIRQAQAGIEELRRLQAVPDMLRAKSQLMSQSGQRTGY